MVKVFISYSWDSYSHQQTALSFTNFLRKKGYDATIDKLLSQKQSALDFMKMMHQSMTNSNKVVIILSQGYKEKADGFKGGVGREYSMILNDMQNNANKYILVSFDGIDNGIVPLGLLGREIINIDSLDNLEALYYKLSDADEFEFAEVASVEPEMLTKKIPEFPTILKPEKSNKRTPVTIENGISKYPNGFYEIDISASDFFHGRLSKTFPGVRGLKIFDDPVKCVSRLLMLLKSPITFERPKSYPIWWFSGGASMPIENFSRISATRILMNNEELSIKRIGVCNNGIHYRACIYVEIYADSPTGLQIVPEEDLALHSKLGEPYRESYAMLENRLITTEEYHDGAYELDNEIIEFDNAEYRVRHLLPYNFVIAGLTSSINSQEFDKHSRPILNNILNGKSTIEELVAMINSLPKNGNASYNKF